MSINIYSATETKENTSKVFIVSGEDELKKLKLTDTELRYIKKKLSDDAKNKLICVNRLETFLFVLMPEDVSDKNIMFERIRKSGHSVFKQLKSEKHNTIAVSDHCNNGDALLAFIEGFALSSYSFDKYKSSDNNKEEYCIQVESKNISGEQIHNLNNVCESVFLARDLVNEPSGSLNAVQLSEAAVNLGKSLGIKTEVFNKKKIESLKMEGLLAVNRGSVIPPTFTIMEWNPENALNEKPYILVGKGVVFDTGGINLKPTSGLDTMKCDMAGAASVIGAISAIAANKLPIWVIGLIPATDNRPGENAIVPGDILKMQNGKTVEILNTDAEGRLILADALCYASRYNPELVIDLATLTGNAAVAIGEHGIVGMGSADSDTMQKLAEAGNDVCERIVWFPFWEEYDKAIKSDIADIKNVGGREGGAITAGKFLSHFVDAPWIHLDIAGSAFITSESNYRGMGGTGIGVRILYRYFQKIVSLHNK